MEMTDLRTSPGTTVSRVVAAAAMPVAAVLDELDVGLAGPTEAQVVQRQSRWGPNAVSSHRARLLPTLWHQLRSPLLGLLGVAALASYLSNT